MPIAGTLASAQAALRWLVAETPNLDKARESLARIVRDSIRAGAVVDRIRNLIKKAPSREDRVDANSAIREVIELTRSEATKDGVVVRTELAESLPLIRGDRVELQQVILNLVLNAVEAMSALTDGPRELQITTSRSGSDHALIAVRDTGPGLAPAVEEKALSRELNLAARRLEVSKLRFRPRWRLATSGTLRRGRCGACGGM
jgi:C4-dicarboxylate-specific signal transduction histidine kinase